MPRLLFISNLFPDARAPYRGLDNATVLHWLADELGWEVRVIALRPSLNPGALLDAEGSQWSARPQDAAFQPRYLAVPYVPKIGSRVNHQLYALPLRTAMADAVHDFKPDVALAAWLFPDGCAVAQIAEELKLPCVLLTQGSDTHQYLDVPARERAIVQAISQSRGVIARSKDLALRLAAVGVPENKLHPIYNGVDQRVFRPRDRQEQRKALGIAADARVALFVGNLLAIKDPGLLVRSFAEHVQTQKDEVARLILVGQGEMRGELATTAKMLNILPQVQFTGPQTAEQVACWMAAADLLCMSSVNEGLPNVILEALNCGLPVLATDVGGIHEVIADPAHGRLVPRGNDSDYAQALTAMLTPVHDREAIARFGAQFSWSAAAREYDRVLRV